MLGQLLLALYELGIWSQQSHGVRDNYDEGGEQNNDGGKEDKLPIFLNVHQCHTHIFPKGT